MISRRLHRLLLIAALAPAFMCALAASVAVDAEPPPEAAAATARPESGEPQSDGTVAIGGHDPVAGDGSADDDANGDTLHHGVSFCRAVAPLLLAHCSACHGDRDAQSEYSVSSYERMLQAGSSGAPPVVPGSIADSYLLELISMEDPDLRMPYHKPRLKDDEIQLLRRWIESGAKFDSTDPTAPIWQLMPPVNYPPAIEPSSPIPITAIAFSPDGKQLAIGGLHGIALVEPQTGRLIRRVQNVAERTYDLTFHPSSGQLVAASGCPGGLGEVRVYDTATGEMVRELARLRDVAFGLAFDLSGARLACCGADRTIRVYDYPSGTELLVAQHHSDWVYRVAFSDDGGRIVSASRDMTSKVIDAKSGDLVTTYNGHLAPVRDAAFLLSNAQVVSCGDDNKIHIWTTAGTGKASAMSETPQDEKKVAEIADFGHDVLRVAVSADSVYAASADARVRQYVTSTRQHQRVFAADHYPVCAVAVHGPSHILATGNHRGQVRLWSVDTGELLSESIP